ncbi:unnamed protein product [Ambrosiozyma monospora]|uniref:Unnamed protein product n=1 Tax=Ambrosiozyma monospora TaxID=43982 RepID=A0A9W6YYS3_AMBMO|nr:unnamed protein product [Ambrosiozyma monospora]
MFGVLQNLVVGVRERGFGDGKLGRQLKQHNMSHLMSPESDHDVPLSRAQSRRRSRPATEGDRSRINFG